MLGGFAALLVAAFLATNGGQNLVGGSLFPDGNLIENGGFEKGISGWSFQGTGGGSGDCGDFDLSNRTMRLFANNCNGAKAYLSQTVVAQPDQAYSWSLDVLFIPQSPLNIPLEGKIIWLNSENDTIRTDSLFYAWWSQSWKNFSGNMTSPPATRYLKLEIGTTNPWHSAWVDDVVVKAG